MLLTVRYREACAEDERRVSVRGLTDKQLSRRQDSHGRLPRPLSLHLLVLLDVPLAPKLEQRILPLLTVRAKVKLRLVLLQSVDDKVVLLRALLGALLGLRLGREELDEPYWKSNSDTQCGSAQKRWRRSSEREGGDGPSCWSRSNTPRASAVEQSVQRIVEPAGQNTSKKGGCKIRQMCVGTQRSFCAKIVKDAGRTSSNAILNARLHQNPTSQKASQN